MWDISPRGAWICLGAGQAAAIALWIVLVRQDEHHGAIGMLVPPLLLLGLGAWLDFAWLIFSSIGFFVMMLFICIAHGVFKPRDKRLYYLPPLTAILCFGAICGILAGLPSWLEGDGGRPERKAAVTKPKSSKQPLPVLRSMPDVIEEAGLVIFRSGPLRVYLRVPSRPIVRQDVSSNSSRRCKRFEYRPGEPYRPGGLLSSSLPRPGRMVCAEYETVPATQRWRLSLRSVPVRLDVMNDTYRPLDLAGAGVRNGVLFTLTISQNGRVLLKRNQAAVDGWGPAQSKMYLLNYPARRLQAGRLEVAVRLASGARAQTGIEIR